MAKAAKIGYKIKSYPVKLHNFINWLFFSFSFINFNFFNWLNYSKAGKFCLSYISLKVKREKEKFVVGCFRPLITGTSHVLKA